MNSLVALALRDGERSRAMTPVKSRRRLRARRFHAALVSVLVFVAAREAPAREGAGASEGVPLRVCEVHVKPGRPYVLGIRTCQPRGLSRGQILIRRPEKPLAAPRQAHVFSLEEDAETVVGMTDSTGLTASFVSPSATVNTFHGPLLAVLVRPDQDNAPGMEFVLEVDPSGTELVDESGEITAFATFDARIVVRSEGDPIVVSVPDVVAEPGGSATVSIDVHELVRVARAELWLHYDPRFLTVVLSAVAWDVRGDLTSEFVRVAPGVMRITLHSSSGSIALLPGALVDVTFQVNPLRVAGDSSVLALDGDSTWLETRRGRRPAIEVRPGTLTIDDWRP